MILWAESQMQTHHQSQLRHIAVAGPLIGLISSTCLYLLAELSLSDSLQFNHIILRPGQRLNETMKVFLSKTIILIKHLIASTIILLIVVCRPSPGSSSTSWTSWPSSGSYRGAV